MATELNHGRGHSFKERRRKRDGRKRKGRGEKTEVPGAQRAVAVCATWWHQFLRFSVLSIVLVGRLWDLCLSGFPLLKTMKDHLVVTTNQDSFQGPSMLCTGTQGSIHCKEKEIDLLLVPSTPGLTRCP